MQLPLSRAVAPDLVLLPTIGSTNAELAARASAAGLPEFSVLVTTDQTAGRGRLGRSWVAPPGRSLAVSVLLVPSRPDALGWLPLLAGLAMARAVAALVPGREVGLKWPNDVQIDGLKVSGLLAELVPQTGGVVIGAGLNLTMTAEELPTPASTSLLLQGADPADLFDRALAGYLEQLRELYGTFSAGDIAAVRAAVREACTTLGRRVRVELPARAELHGTAEDLDPTGRLVVRDDRGGVVAVAAGDVTHARLENGPYSGSHA